MRRLFALSLAVGGSFLAGSAAASEKYDLRPAAPQGATTQVSIEVEIGGDLIVKPQLRSTLGIPAGAALDSQKLPMTVHASFAYDEQVLNSKAGAPVSSVRVYRQAEAELKVNQTTKKPRLRGNIGPVLAHNEGSRIILAALQGPLTREELDLVEVTGDPLAIDGILPTQPVEDNEDWPVNEETMGRLLGLDGVALCEITAELDETNAGFARINFSGRVHGAMEGGSGEFEVRGVALFDRKLRRLTQANLAVTDRRPIGPATPGADAVSKIRIVLKPVPASSAITPAIASAAAGSLAKMNRDLLLTVERQGFEALVDRRWFISAEERESTTLRCVGPHGLMGQTTLVVLPRRSADRHTTLADLQRDVQHSLGKNLRQIVATEDWKTAAGNHAIGVVANGEVDGVPVQWRYFLVAPTGEGHRIRFSTTLEATQVEKFAKSDRDLAHRLRLIPLPKGVTPLETIQGAPNQERLGVKPAAPLRTGKRVTTGPRLF